MTTTVNFEKFVISLLNIQVYYSINIKTSYKLILIYPAQLLK
jgi:hypothetical protein